MTESEAPAVDEAPATEPSWWHRSHPTFAGLVGFFSGVAYVIVVPGVYAAVLSLLLSDDSAKRLFPLVLVALVVPLVLLIPRKTRRFAMFMLLGLVATALVIGVTAALVIWVMVQLGQADAAPSRCTTRFSRRLHSSSDPERRARRHAVLLHEDPTEEKKHEDPCADSAPGRCRPSTLAACGGAASGTTAGGSSRRHRERRWHATR